MGRPPKGQIVGKRENFATRITSEMRQSLDAEAERTGRSVSQVAELWLERGRLGCTQDKLLMERAEQAKGFNDLWNKRHDFAPSSPFDARTLNTYSCE